MPQDITCDRCHRPLPRSAQGAICPACMAQLAQAPWLDADADPGPELSGPAPTPPAVCPPPFRHFGDYELIEEIARGGMGVVYKARQKGLNRTVALKLVRDALLASETDLTRFRAEAEAAAALRHPGIVTIHEIGEAEGHLYFSMNYVEGRNLAETLRNETWPPNRVATCVRDLADAVHYAHLQGVVHRDLKPSNIVMDGDGHPHITDFGLARKVDRDARLTLTGTLLGTPSYMSPEQAAGNRSEVGPASDTYSLGAILYELLTSRPPFRAESTLDTLQLVRDGTPVPPRLLNPKAPRDLETICLACLEKDPRRRYGSASELSADLTRFLTDQPIHARPPGVFDRLGKWTRRKPALAGLLAVTSTGSAAFLCFLLIVNHHLETQKRHLDAANLRLRAEQQHLQQALAGETLALGQAKEANRNLQETFLALQRTAYARAIAIVRQEWDAHRVDRANQVLEQAGPEDLRGFEWRYLRRLASGADARGRPGHLLRQSTFHPALTLPIAATWDSHRRCAVWADTGQAIHCEGEAAETRGGRVKWASADGRWLVLGPGAGFSRDEERLVTVWNRQLHQPQRAFTLPPLRQLDAVALDAGGTLLAAGITVYAGETNSGGISNGYAETNSILQWWSLPSGDVVHSVSMPAGEFSAISLLRNSPRLVAVRRAGVTVWDVPSGRRLSSIDTAEPGQALLTAALSPDEKTIALLMSGEDAVRLVDLETGKESRPFSAPHSQITAIAFSPDGHRFAAGSQSGVVWVWNVTNHQALPTYQLRWAVASVGFSADSRRVLAGNGSPFDDALISGQREEYHVHEIDAPQDFRKLVSGTGGCWTVAYSPDAKSLISTHETGQVIVHDLTGSSDALPLVGHKGSVFGAAFNPVAPRIATAGNDRTVRLWDRRTGEALHSVDDNKTSVHTVAFSPDGTLLASTSADGLVKVRHAETAETRLVFEGHKHEGRSLSRMRIATTVVFSPDGREIASGAYDTRVRIWNPTDGSERLALLHEGSVYCLAYEPAGARLASCTTRGEVKLWDTASGRELLSLSGHPQTVHSVAFSPDGRRLATTAKDTVRIFETAGGLELLSLVGAGKGVAFSPDGRGLAAGASNGDVLVWDGSFTVERE